jgi:hypothetical protein
VTLAMMALVKYTLDAHPPHCTAGPLFLLHDVHRFVTQHQTHYDCQWSHYDCQWSRHFSHSLSATPNCATTDFVAASTLDTALLLALPRSASADRKGCAAAPVHAGEEATVVGSAAGLDVRDMVSLLQHSQHSSRSCVCMPPAA